MRDRISTYEFADLLRRAQAHRINGASQIVAVHNACDDVGVSRSWAMPVHCFLDASPSLAEAWADRRIEEGLKGLAQRIEG